MNLTYIEFCYMEKGQTLWKADEGWQLPEFPEPQDGYYSLGIDPSLTPYPFPLHRKIHEAGYSCELRVYRGLKTESSQAMDGISWEYIGQFTRSDRTPINALSQMGIPRDAIVALGLDTPEEIAARLPRDEQDALRLPIEELGFAVRDPR
ncbi:MAG: hypothetical protein AB4290_28275 [Spirulina sp.]